MCSVLKFAESRNQHDRIHSRMIQVQNVHRGTATHELYYFLLYNQMGESGSYFAPVSILDQENIQQSFCQGSRNSAQRFTHYNTVSTALSVHGKYKKNPLFPQHHLVCYVYIHICTFPYQYNSVNHNSTGNSQSPSDWLIGYEDQNKWLCASTHHSQVHAGVASVVNAKPCMSIALIVDNHMYIIVAVVIYNTAVCCLSPASIGRCTHTNTCTLCDLAAASKACRDELVQCKVTRAMCLVWENSNRGNILSTIHPSP